MDKSSKSIVIIGAGLAGFSTAARLIENGFTNLTILEAENRIGGRVHSIDYRDGKIDMGAQWCHGQKGNIIYEMAHKFYNFGSTPFDTISETFLFSNGSTPDQKSCQLLTNFVFKILEDDDDEMKEFGGTIGNFILEKLNKAIQTQPKFKAINPKLVESVKEHMERAISGYYASKSWHDISAKLDAEYVEAEGNQHLTWKKNGFVTIFDYISKKAISNSQYLDIESKIQLSKKVTHIKYGSDKVEIETADGGKYSADHVVFTGSLGVLKKNYKTLFSPALSQERITAIEHYAFGAVGKIFLEFDKPFWPVNSSSFVSYAFLWNEEQKAEARATNREWLFLINSFFIVDQYPNLLEAFLGGGDINKFEEISDEKLIEDCMWFFGKFLGKSIPKPKLISRTKWLTNENFLGSYSFFSVDAEKFRVGPEELGVSIKNANFKPLILFAGEAIDFESAPSYAHGAVTSGYRSANELIHYYLQL